MIASHASSQNLRGILLMVASMALFGVEDMFLKWAAEGLPIGQIIFVSGAFGLPVFVLMAWAQGQRVLVREALQPAVIARNIGEMIGSAGYVAALATVPLSTVSAVLQAMPLAVTMAAALFMQEQVGWRRWTAIAVGFAGVLLVIRPGIDGFRPEALYVLVTVAGLTLRDLASRRIPAVVTTAQVSAWGLMAVAVLGAGMMLASGEVRAVSAGQGLVLLGAVAFGTAGYWAITAATRTGEVSVVAPFRYTRLVFAMAIGALVFGEWPDGWTYAGAALIIGSGLYSFARERARKRASHAG
ncbi:MAG: DMT family transporter [Tabrizicola sp.]|uniref:DMT family transporter n=1 Tax=Tabrizicola sp. TaxID=2005166 RepID=UPI0027354F47|nr:DMT family transporter [Tabrizicola sp.]MDP3264568.1 DMT family transporter [Tabrizicola sp.]MDP3649452.1 DMT family transporter [Paracoccaceae bacterium]MDZ4067806.1 DMT family transporter [Tabrizicola sp.]